MGGFDLAAASAVGVGPDTTLDMVSRLQAKSLLTSADGDFRLLESIRLYARQRLAESGEEDATFEALTSWLAELAEAFVTTPLSVPGKIRRRTAAQAGALRIAWEWTRSRQDDRHVLLATALSIADANRGFLADARKVLHAALSQPQGSARHRCAAVDRAAWYAGFQGDFTEGIRCAREALDVARCLDEPALIVNCLRTLACVQQMAGELEPALRNRTECVRMVRQLAEPIATATCLAHLAWSVSLSGDQPHAQALAEESLAICRSLNSVSLAAEALNVLGGIALALNQLDRAENAFREVLHTDAKYPHNVPTAIEGLAVIAAKRGQRERALRLNAEAQPMRRATGLVGDPYWQREVADALGLPGQTP
jgi:tetratricopeptide (TPR) repeat protein